MVVLHRQPKNAFEQTVWLPIDLLPGTVEPAGAEKDWPANPSAWRTNQLFLSHAALTDMLGERFLYDQQMARGALELAGASQQDGITRVFLKTWSARIGPREHHLEAQTKNFALDLSLLPRKPPILHGQDGYSTSSSGTFVLASGKTRHLRGEDFQVNILDYWKSPQTRATYPSRWRIRVHPLGLDLLAFPNLEGQELVTYKTTQTAYCEGSMSIEGKAWEKQIKGIGYIEMTGYAKPFNLLK